MEASNMTNMSIAKSMSTGVVGMVPAELNAALLMRISIMSCGIIIGKPSIAMMAAFCCAFAAIAARKVKTRLRLNPPNKTIPMKGAALITGLPKNNLNSK